VQQEKKTEIKQQHSSAAAGMKLHQKKKGKTA
jgi:hypothetical protein